MNDLKKSLSYLGGLLSIALSIYAIFLGIIFPIIFWREITTYFLEKEIKNENDNSSNKKII